MKGRCGERKALKNVHRKQEAQPKEADEREEETKKGNWDLRIRKDGTLDDSKDKEHEGNKSWFANGHPNEKGVKAVADEEFKILSQILEKRKVVRPARKRRRTTRD